MTEIVLRKANVFDEAGGFDGPLDVQVRDGQIVAVGQDLDAGPDAAEVDLSDLWLLPGLFDCHLHLGHSKLNVMEALRTPVTEWALESARNARAALDAGVTFVRDAGGIDAGVRDGLEKGYALGSRVQVSIGIISQTGGCLDGWLAGPGASISTEYFLPDFPGRPPYLVDSEDEMRHAVRSTLRAGADWIKISTTGALLAPNNEPETPELTFEEISVAVFEAGRQGKPVMTHAYGGEGLMNAVRAGVRSIEHGTFLSEEQAVAMAEAGCWLVPTLTTLWDAVGWAEQGLLPPYAVPKAQKIRQALGDVVRLAKDHGVAIAAGTDIMSADRHGASARELLLLHEAGLTLEEALLAGTIRSAELCGVGDRYGRIAAGYELDAIVLDSDPHELEVLTRPGGVTGVFKGGVPVVAHPRLVDAGIALVT